MWVSTDSVFDQGIAATTALTSPGVASRWASADTVWVSADQGLAYCNSTHLIRCGKQVSIRWQYVGVSRSGVGLMQQHSPHQVWQAGEHQVTLCGCQQPPCLVGGWPAARDTAWGPSGCTAKSPPHDGYRMPPSNSCSSTSVDRNLLDWRRAWNMGYIILQVEAVHHQPQRLELSELTVTGTVSVEHKKDDNCGGSFVY